MGRLHPSSLALRPNAPQLGLGQAGFCTARGASEHCDGLAPGHIFLPGLSLDAWVASLQQLDSRDLSKHSEGSSQFLRPRPRRANHNGFPVIVNKHMAVDL